MKETLYMELIFENCDSITLPIDDIEYFYANNIQQSINLQEGQLNIYKSVGNLMLSIRKSAFDKLTDFADMLDDEEEIEHHKLKNRINSNDITQIHFLDKHYDPVESLYVEWSDEDEWHNKYQKQEIIDDEYLVININKEG
jgi:hypothetical protein